MNDFNQGLKVGTDFLHWCLGVIAGTIGFCLPFLAVVIFVGLVALIIGGLVFAISDKLTPKPGSPQAESEKT